MEKHHKIKDRFIRVKDSKGNEYVCATNVLTRVEEATDEMLSKCYNAKPPQETTGA